MEVHSVRAQHGWHRPALIWRNHLWLHGSQAMQQAASEAAAAEGVAEEPLVLTDLLTAPGLPMLLSCTAGMAAVQKPEVWAELLVSQPQRQEAGLG